jgi:hypothetical protein
MVKINLLTYLTFELNYLVDSGYKMTVKEAKDLCMNRKILVDLEDKFPFKTTHFDLSILRTHPDTEVEIENAFFEIAGGAEDSAFLVKNNGLCLLIGYAQELIQIEARKHGI